MIKKFNKRQLLDQCVFTAKEAQVILDYQKKLPILVENDDIDGFCVNARDLWEQLDRPQGKFADWTKRKLVTKKTKGGIITFQENKDYIGFSQNCEKPSGGRPTQEYPLKEGYKAMQKALDEYMLRMIQRNADDWDYRIEADAINIIATGFKAQEIRNYVGCKDNITRDSLTATYNEYKEQLNHCSSSVE